MAENKGKVRAETDDRERRSGQPGLDEELLKQGAARRSAAGGREDVTDRDVGQEGISQKGVGGYGADADAEAERRSDKPLKDNG